VKELCTKEVRVRQLYVTKVLCVCERVLCERVVCVCDNAVCV
jgi:hypothetical protein